MLILGQTIFFGANDARLPDTPGFSQTVSIYQYRENLVKIAMHPAVQAHRPQLILITPPPVEERLGLANDQEKGINVVRRTAENTARYAEVVRQVGKELNVPVLDVWTAFMEEAGWKEGEPLPGSSSIEQNPVLVELLHDGLHLTGPAYKIIYKQMMELIEAHLPDQMPEKLPFVFPAWDQTDAWVE